MIRWVMMVRGRDGECIKLSVERRRNYNRGTNSGCNGWWYSRSREIARDDPIEDEMEEFPIVDEEPVDRSRVMQQSIFM